MACVSITGCPVSIAGHIESISGHGVSIIGRPVSIAGHVESINGHVVNYH